MHRNIDGSTPLLSEADADYALALLVALRRPLSRTTATSGNCLDRKMRAALEHLPRTVRPDDCNRQHLQETAQALLQQTGL